VWGEKGQLEELTRREYPPRSLKVFVVATKPHTGLVRDEAGGSACNNNQRRRKVKVKARSKKRGKMLRRGKVGGMGSSKVGGKKNFTVVRNDSFESALRKEKGKNKK